MFPFRSLNLRRWQALRGQQFWPNQSWCKCHWDIQLSWSSVFCWLEGWLCRWFIKPCAWCSAWWGSVWAMIYRSAWTLEWRRSKEHLPRPTHRGLGAICSSRVYLIITLTLPFYYFFYPTLHLRPNRPRWVTVLSLKTDRSHHHRSLTCTIILGPFTIITVLFKNRILLSPTGAVAFALFLFIIKLVKQFNQSSNFIIIRH